MGSTVEKPKFYLEKDGKKLKILSFNKKEQTVKVKGELTEFQTSLSKALANGYKFIKEN